MMIDPNTRTDYGKMQKLIRLDKLDENRKGVLFKIAEEGQIVTDLFTTFPAKMLTDEKIFPRFAVLLRYADDCRYLSYQARFGDS